MCGVSSYGKAYDFLSGTRMLSSSFVQSASETLRSFPMLRENLSDDDVASGERKLCGSVTYYDGQMDDSRLNVMLASTATSAGALCANYVEVIDVLREKDSNTGERKICGVKARDRLNGREFTIKAKSVINAAGPFCDGIREKTFKKSDSKTIFKPTVTPAGGAHVSLPSYYVPDDIGLIIPKTKVSGSSK